MLLNLVNKDNNSNQKKLKDLMERYTKSELNKPFPDYTPAKGAIKAIELLNNNIHLKLFSVDKLPTHDTVLIYRIYFQLLNHEINTCKQISDFWKECCVYFTKNGNIGKPF
jgi:hypothetical protein